MKAKDMLPAHLHEDAQVFIQQETTHYKGHIQFNNAVAWKDVDTKPLERDLARDYERFLLKYSLRFNLAYCEGFESTSIIPMDSFFNEFQELWKGSHPKVEAMWKWHFAEEHEHRNTVHDVYVALYGRGPIAWLYRVVGLWFCSYHMYKYAFAFAKLFLARYREGMSAEQLAESRAREKQVKKLAQKKALKHMIRIMSPFYNPDKRPAPDGVFKLLSLDKVPAPIPGAASTVPTAG
jgi:predicted metal-dependent hydrolase